MTTWAVTGHRPQKIGGYGNVEAHRLVFQQIFETLLVLKPIRMIIGMAQGVDQLTAQACVELDIPFTAAVPCKDQEKVWPKPAQLVYYDLLKYADEVELVSSEYSVDAMQARNRWMVDNSIMLLAVWDGSPGGTANCVAYARSLNRGVYYLRPRWD